MHDDNNTLLNRIHPNLSKLELEGKDSLVAAQRSRDIVIKPADKSGEICIMNAKDYVSIIEEDLKATYRGPGGEILNYYEEVNPGLLLRILEDARALIEEGLERGILNESDALIMMPADPKPGRYYGMMKLQKPKES